jgi:hypothetical protein
MTALAIIAGSAVALAAAFLIYDNRKHKRAERAKLEDEINETTAKLSAALHDHPNCMDLHAALRARLVRLRKQLECI